MDGSFRELIGLGFQLGVFFFAAGPVGLSSQFIGGCSAFGVSSGQSVMRNVFDTISPKQIRDWKTK